MKILPLQRVSSNKQTGLRKMQRGIRWVRMYSVKAAESLSGNFSKVAYLFFVIVTTIVAI